MPWKTNLVATQANRATCWFLAANEKIFDSYHLLSQSICSRGVVWPTAPFSVAVILPFLCSDMKRCARNCREGLGSISLAPPCSPAPGFHPLDLMWNKHWKKWGSSLEWCKEVWLEYHSEIKGRKMHAGHLIVPDEKICEVILEWKCRLHALQDFSIDWDITGKYLVRDRLNNWT